MRKDIINQHAPADDLKRQDYSMAIIFAAFAFVALQVVRGALFYYESFDYIHSLSRWTSIYRDMTFFEGLGTKVGNYNQPYMYFLNIISRIGISDLYLIKMFSVTFDVLLAYFVMKIVSLKTESANMRILAFMLALAVPTVILNGSMWGQCDVIYASLAIGSVYFALCSKSKTAYAFIALALSFKLQAAFIMPVFAVFIVCKKVRLQDIWVFFAVYFATLLPALIAGFPIRDLFLVYFDQTNTYHHLKLNAVNIWQFVENVEFAHFKTAGLYIAGVAMLGLLYFAYVYRGHIVKTVDYIRLAFLFAVILPFLLPQMHDRFFFMADIIALLVFLFDKRRWFVPVVAIFCSFIAYAWILMEYITIFDYKLAALGLLAVIIVVLRDLVISLTEESRISEARLDEQTH